MQSMANNMRQLAEKSQSSFGETGSGFACGKGYSNLHIHQTATLFCVGYCNLTCRFLALVNYHEQEWVKWYRKTAICSNSPFLEPR